MWRTTETAPVRIIFCTSLLLGLLVISMSPLVSFLHDSKQHKVIELENRIESLKSADPDAFISVWDTTKVSLESSNSDQVKLPLESDGTYDFFVDWGDGSNDTITSWNQTESTHTYSTNGIYTIQITRIIEGWRFNHAGDYLKIIEIQQWGCLRLGNNGNYFDGCEYLTCNAYDNLNLTGTTNLEREFAYCRNLGSSGNMDGWDVSKVMDMSWMFSWANSFNQPIEN